MVGDHNIVYATIGRRNGDIHYNQSTSWVCYNRRFQKGWDYRADYSHNTVNTRFRSYNTVDSFLWSYVIIFACAFRVLFIDM